MSNDHRKPKDDKEPDDGQDDARDQNRTVNETQHNLTDSTVESIQQALADNDNEKTNNDLSDSTVESIEDALDNSRQNLSGDKNDTETTTDLSLETKFDSGGTEPNDDPQKTKPILNDTIQIEPIDPFGMNAAKSSFSDIDRTLDFTATVARIVSEGNSNQSTQDTEISNYLKTVELGEDFRPGEETDEPTSRMGDPNISQTLNPKDLSPEDAELWESLAGTLNGQSTQNIPAIERSFSETKLQLRPRELSTPKAAPGTPSDYRLVRLLGRGGMGNVFLAKQQSLDRVVAVKIIKPIDDAKRQKLEAAGKLEKVEEDRRHQFLSEAVVTGDLDHPNIVPIYDIALTPDNTLFYGMKRVVGTPWSDVIEEKTLDENLEIFLKVCDAVGFAHTRGVVHRDIKPENIMLGDFGVVMLMDWGLALAKPHFEKLDSIVHTAGLGGTPAFMAPEMALGPLDSIGAASDIYLLGATLFMIITGKAPHQAKDVKSCIRAVASNKIVDTRPEHQGELLNIAMKAMKTLPAERFENVLAMQDAIRKYRAHTESISLAERAHLRLNEATNNGQYNDFSRATYSFEEAITLWPENENAKLGLAATRIAHADAAYQKNDYELGLSVLDAAEPDHQPIIHKINQAIRERDTKASRLTLFKRVAAAMLAFIIVGGAIGLYLINDSRNKANADRARAVASEKEAKTLLSRALASEAAAKSSEEKARESESNAIAQKEAAEKARQEETKAKEAAIVSQREERKAKTEALIAQDAAEKAEANERNARIAEEDAADKARKQEKIALQERDRVKYEVYMSKIGLAKARVERNEFEGARGILQSLETDPGNSALGWEWRWLWNQASQSIAADRTDSAAIDLAVSHSAERAIVALEDGSLEVLTFSQAGVVTDQQNLRLESTSDACSIAFSHDDQFVAVAMVNGDIDVWEADLGRRVQELRGHQDQITDVTFTRDGRVISASHDRTARVWDIRSGRELSTCWHIAPVRGVSTTNSNNQTLLATAVSDSVSGRAVVWSIPNRGTAKAKRIGEFLEHEKPVSSIAISADASLVASGDVEGNVFVWQPTAVKSTDYARAISSAIANMKEGESSARNPESRKSKQLVDPDLDTNTARIVNANAPSAFRAHSDIIESIRFSDDGSSLITTSDDYTIKVWDTQRLEKRKTLRGHGGWVTDVSFIGDSNEKVISASRDSTIRLWDLKTYVGAASTLARTKAKSDRPGQPRTRQSKPHEDEIWSAAFDSTGTKVVTASRDQTAHVLQIDPETLTFSEVAELRDTEKPTSELEEGTAFLAMSAAVDRAHKKLYVGSADSTVRVWDLELGTEISQATGTGLNNTIALSLDGTRLLTGASSPDVKAILWDVDPTGRRAPRVKHRLQGHEQSVTAFAISPDGRLLFTGDRIGLGVLWDARTGKQIGTRFQNNEGFRINAVHFSKDGKRVLIASDDQQISIVDLSGRKVVARLPHEGPVTQLSVSADGRLAATLRENRTKTRFEATARLWDLTTQKGYVLDRIAAELDDESKTRSDSARINSVEFGIQSSTVCLSLSATGGKPAQVKLFQVRDLLSGSRKPKAFALPTSLRSAQVAMPISDTNLLTLCGDAAFRWDLQTMTHIKSYRSHGSVTNASFSFDGRFVATGSRSIKIWDASSGVALGKLENPHQSIVRAVQFSPSGTNYVLASAGDDGHVFIWQWNPEQKSFSKIREAVFSRDSSRIGIRSVSFDPTGRSLLVTGTHGVARIWPFAEKKLQIVYDIPGQAELTCGSYSSDGKWVAIGGDDKLARMWNLTPGVQSPQKPIILSGHADRIEDVHVLTDGTPQVRLLTASRDKSARVWDPRFGNADMKGREIISLRRHTLGVTAIDATVDGQLVMTAGRDGTVVLWPATKPKPIKETVEKNLFDDL